MKVRTDFVSNSSSSSFIVNTATNLSRLNITKDDLQKAVRLLMGVPLSEVDKPNKVDACFAIFDWDDDNDIAKINERYYKSVLSGFISPLVCVSRDKNGTISEYFHDGGDCKEVFENLCEGIRKTYDTNFFRYTPGEDLKIYSYKYETQEYIPVDDSIVRLVKDAYMSLGVASNYEIAMSVAGTFTIHVYEGYLGCMDDLHIENGDNGDGLYYKTSIGVTRYSTEDYTFSRFNEILLYAIAIIKNDTKLKKDIESGDCCLNDVIGGCFHEG